MIEEIIETHSLKKSCQLCLGLQQKKGILKILPYVGAQNNVYFWCHMHIYGNSEHEKKIYPNFYREESG